MKFVTRFAPSPTGPLHLGHAYSAMLAYDMALAEGGDFLLRIDDLDQSRARNHWEDQIYDDLSWLGLCWPEPCRKQSQCQLQYDLALDILWSKGLLFECTCSRRDIREAQSAPQESQVQYGPDGLIYPGTCRHSNRPSNPLVTPRPANATLRLDMARALEYSFRNTNLFLPPRAVEKTRYAYFAEYGPSVDPNRQSYEFTPEMMLKGIGDVVVRRKNMGAAYHLAVVVDDQEQGVSHVVRGEDLLEATMIHLLIGHLLDGELLHYWRQPTYHHHKLIRDENGKRLAKRDDARAIAKYRAEGATPQDIRKMVGLS